MRAIFRGAFENAGLRYYNPHSFRKTLAQVGERVCLTPEHFKAWSQNLGHDQVMATLTSYGAVGRQRQAEIIRTVAIKKLPTDEVLKLLQKLTVADSEAS